MKDTVMHVGYIRLSSHNAELFLQEAQARRIIGEE
jgi:hypothetical protein